MPEPAAPLCWTKDAAQPVMHSSQMSRTVLLWHESHVCGTAWGIRLRTRPSRWPQYEQDRAGWFEGCLVSQNTTASLHEAATPSTQLFYASSSLDSKAPDRLEPCRLHQTTGTHATQGSW